MHRVLQIREDVKAIRSRSKTKIQEDVGSRSDRPSSWSRIRGRPKGPMKRNVTPAPAAHTAARGSSSSPASCRVMHGVGHLVDTVCGIPFDVSDSSFFQTNTEQAEVCNKCACVTSASFLTIHVRHPPLAKGYIAEPHEVLCAFCNSTPQ